MTKGDSDAIAENYVVGKGFIIRPKVVGYKPTELEKKAINRLFLEWYYAFEEGC